jgi:hypothetical protein
VTDGCPLPDENLPSRNPSRQRRSLLPQEAVSVDQSTADLAAARRLVESCGYWHRKEELADAKKVILCL